MLWDPFAIGAAGSSLLDLAAVGFLVVFGANLGSFLNVVAYRVPQGRSVVFGGSHCPVCGRAIRPWHNLPVVGWLMLGGRCRDCLVQIPFRYPLVEALAAVVIGSVAAVELLSGGINLPVGNQISHEAWWRGVDGLLLRPNWRLVAICLLHVAGLATLLAWALIERDRQRLPSGWWLGTLTLLLAVSVGVPWLQPASLTALGDQLNLVATSPLPAWQAAGLVGLVGMLTGWLVGALLRELGLTGELARQGLALIGGLCGWQAALTTAVLWFVVSVMRVGLERVLATASGQKPSPDRDEWLATPRLLLADLVAALTLQLLAWRWLDGLANGLVERLVFVLAEWA
jgi:leader peptidase (prepilin peptidase)/N-methyltransferase